MSDNFPTRPAALPYEDIPWEELPMVDIDAPLIPGVPVVKPSPKRQPTVPEWNMMRPRIKELYIDQNKTSMEVRAALTVEFNFEPTKRQFTAKLERWGLKKNASKKERAEIVEKLAVAGEGNEVPKTGPFRMNQNKLSRWKRETKEFVQQEDLKARDYDVDEKSDLPIVVDDDGASIWQAGMETPDICFDEFYKTLSFETDKDRAEIWQSWMENPWINFDETYDIPSMATNDKINHVELQRPFLTAVPKLDENLDEGEAMEDVEEIPRAAFFEEREETDAEGGLCRLNETLSQPEFEEGLANGTKKFWDAADIPGSPKLNRLMAALKIGINHKCDVEPMSLDEPVAGEGCISQTQISELFKRDPIKRPEHGQWAFTDVSRVLVRSKKRTRRPNILPSYLRHMLRRAGAASPLHGIDPFPRFIDLDDETNIQNLPPQPVLSLQQQKRDCEAGIKKLSQMFPSNNLRLAEERVTLGNIYWDLGKYSNAEDLYRQALITQAEVLGEDHYDTLSTALEIVDSMGYQGRYSEAIKIHQSLHRRILSISSTVSSLARRSIRIMADIEYNLGNYTSSKSRSRELLQICLSNFGLRDISTWTALRELALDLQATNEYNQSEHLFSTAQQLRNEIPSMSDSMVCLNMARFADLLVQQGRYEEGAKLAKEAVNVAEGALRADSPDRLFCSRMFGQCLRYQGKLDESEEILRDVVAKRTILYGSGHANTVDSMLELAQTLVALKRWNEAITNFEEVYVGRARIYGFDHNNTMASWDLVIDCYEQPELGLDRAAINEKLETLHNKAVEAVEAVRARQEMEDFESDEEESDGESDEEEEHQQQAKKVRVDLCGTSE